MKVVCISKKDGEDFFTIGKVYDVISGGGPMDPERHVLVIDDDGETMPLYGYEYIELEQYRQQQIDKIVE